jgi:hypothetical protein
MVPPTLEKSTAPRCRVSPAEVIDVVEFPPDTYNSTYNYKLIRLLAVRIILRCISSTSK